MAAAEINPRLWDASTPLVERVALAFDEKGPLTKAVKGFCVREGQREFAVEAARGRVEDHSRRRGGDGHGQDLRLSDARASCRRDLRHLDGR